MSTQSPQTPVFIGRGIETVFALKSLILGLESRHLKASHFFVMYNDIILFHLRDHINCDLTLFKELFD